VSAPRVAIVGAAGFIGRFTANGAVESSFDTQLLTSKNANQFTKPAFWKSFSPTHVVWLASKVTPSVAHGNDDLVQREILEFKSALTALQEISPQVIFASSGGTVYTGESLPYSEGDEAHGANEYGKLKLLMEEALSASGIPHTILRISNAYGFGQRFDRGQGVISVWINEILNNQPISVFGSLQNVRDFIYIDDVVSAIIATIETSDSQGVFNIGSGNGVELNNIIEELKVISEKDFDVNESAGRSVDRKAIWLDIAKAKEVLKWSPKVSLHEGLERTWTMAKKNMQ
jgi:UDP-glucose 4-epimerase